MGREMGSLRECVTRRGTIFGDLVADSRWDATWSGGDQSMAGKRHGEPWIGYRRLLEHDGVDGVDEVESVGIWPLLYGMVGSVLGVSVGSSLRSLARSQPLRLTKTPSRQQDFWQSLQWHPRRSGKRSVGVYRMDMPSFDKARCL